MRWVSFFKLFALCATSTALVACGSGWHGPKVVTSGEVSARQAVNPWRSAIEAVFGAEAGALSQEGKELRAQHARAFVRDLAPADDKEAAPSAKEALQQLRATQAELLAASEAASGRPVILVPGYLDLDVYFVPVQRRLAALNRPHSLLSLFPNIGDIPTSAKRLAERVEEVRRARGVGQVDLIAHSEGGLISRHYIRFLGGERTIGRLITLSTPHHGTYVSYLGPGEAARQMRPGSDFLRQLNEGDPSWGSVQYTSIRGGLDQIVIPHKSMILDGAENVLVRFADHATIFTQMAVGKHIEGALLR